MGFEMETLKGWSEGRRCDYCQTASASAFCSSHSAFLCLNCDSRIHPLSHAPHERVWICDVCEQAPAAVTCSADAAALCVTCDADIHSANPLARRHQRLAIVPFVDPTKSRASLASNLLVPTETLSNPGEGLGVPSGQGFDSGHFGFEFEFDDEVKNFDAGDLLEFDSVVPVQVKPTPPLPHPPARPIFGHESNCFDIDFGASKLSPFSLVPSQSISHNSVSSSSVDVGLVPDGNSMSEISFPCMNMTHSAPYDVVSKGATFSSNITTTTNTTSMHRQTRNNTNIPWLDREARVLRYREKRKNRKFEKTIRYASRKAYAEIRPRIKGRFAKRTEDELYSSSASVSFVGVDTQYGVVPIF